MEFCGRSRNGFTCCSFSVCGDGCRKNFWQRVLCIEASYQTERQQLSPVGSLALAYTVLDATMSFFFLGGGVTNYSQEDVRCCFCCCGVLSPPSSQVKNRNIMLDDHGDDAFGSWRCYLLHVTVTSFYLCMLSFLFHS